MAGRGNIVLNLLRFGLVAAGAAFTVLLRILKPIADQNLDVSPDRFAKLSELRSEAKYVDVPGTIYNGMRPESLRLSAEEQINRLIDRLRNGLPFKPSKKFVLAEFAKTLAEFPGTDTEDREQLVRYLQRIMAVFGIASSDGLFSRWLYGSILGTIVDHDRGKATVP